MEECPRCKHLTLSFDLVDSKVSCCRCHYEKSVASEVYFEKFDAMPKLMKSLELNGYSLK
jgi:hypothetical protein